MVVNSYIVSPRCKKSIVETQQYVKTIQGVEYTMTKTLVWRWGSFEVELTEAQLKHLQSCEIGTEIQLNHYTHELIELIDCCMCDYEIIQPTDVDVEEVLQEDTDDGMWDPEEWGWDLDEVTYVMIGSLECKSN